jgi:hypothetical protein
MIIRNNNIYVVIIAQRERDMYKSTYYTSLSVYYDDYGVYVNYMNIYNNIIICIRMYTHKHTHCLG